MAGDPQEKTEFWGFRLLEFSTGREHCANTEGQVKPAMGALFARFWFSELHRVQATAHSDE